MTIALESPFEDDYPQEWGLCERILLDNVPNGVRIYENILTHELGAVFDDNFAHREINEIVKKYSIVIWVFNNSL